MVRSNKQIWRIARWLWDRRLEIGGWCATGQNVRDYYYDVVTELMKKLQLNEFTGEDTHGD